MAELSGPFDVDPPEVEGGYEGMYQAEWSRMARVWHDDAVVGDLGGPSLQVFISGSQVGVRVGEAELRGHWYRNTAVKSWSPAMNSAGQPRLDRVVLRLDRGAKKITAEIVQGSAGSPMPALTQSDADDGVWELPLGGYRVDPGSDVPTAAWDDRWFQGLRLWRPSSSGLLPASGATLWQEAVVPDGRVFRWDGTGWRLARLPLTTWEGVVVADVLGRALNGTSVGRYSVADGWVSGACTVTSADVWTTSSGSLRPSLPFAALTIDRMPIGGWSLVRTDGVDRNGTLRHTNAAPTAPLCMTEQDGPILTTLHVGDTLSWSFHYPLA